MTVRQRIAAVRGYSPALKFVLMVGIMSFFADFTYEGSRSITGPYLGLLGAGAFTISVVSGAGEFIGYNIRLFSGRGADRTGKYWPVTIGGYILQMSVVPLLALAGNWQVAAVLIIAERVGKGILGEEQSDDLSWHTETVAAASDNYSAPSMTFNHGIVNIVRQGTGNSLLFFWAVNGTTAWYPETEPGSGSVA